jgi:hypothetical protein
VVDALFFSAEVPRFCILPSSDSRLTPLLLMVIFRVAHLDRLVICWMVEVCARVGGAMVPRGLRAAARSNPNVRQSGPVAASSLSPVSNAGETRFAYRIGRVANYGNKGIRARGRRVGGGRVMLCKGSIGSRELVVVDSEGRGRIVEKGAGVT